MNDGVNNPEELALQLHDIARKLRAAGRNDLILSALGSSMLDELKSEAVRGRLTIVFFCPTSAMSRLTCNLCTRQSIFSFSITPRVSNSSIFQNTRMSCANGIARRRE